jgi:metal transporter CNNM
MLLLTWIGIALCITQSATLSGLNLAFFSVSKLRLELEASKNNKDAKKVLALREDSNFLLVTILWGNVGVNVLLALLSGSVLTGVIAFLFSTVLITIFGEIIPQAYFSRNAIKVGALLSPVLRFYQIILFPAAKPTAIILDTWLGKEGIHFYRERDLREVIKMHVESAETEIDKVEGKGALNFLAIDDLPLSAEGEIIDPESIVSLKFNGHKPVFPVIKPSASNRFLKKLNKSGKKWIVIVDAEMEPKLVVDSDEFIRDTFFESGKFNPIRHCHRPIIIRESKAKLGDVIPRLKVNPEHGEDDVIDEDIILFWNDEKRVITGSDILGRLLRGIVKNQAIAFEKEGGK